jgi:hypothetical protein
LLLFDRRLDLFDVSDSLKAISFALSAAAHPRRALPLLFISFVLFFKTFHNFDFAA